MDFRFAYRENSGLRTNRPLLSSLSSTLAAATVSHRKNAKRTRLRPRREISVTTTTTKRINVDGIIDGSVIRAPGNVRRSRCQSPTNLSLYRSGPRATGSRRFSRVENRSEKTGIRVYVTRTHTLRDVWRMRKATKFLNLLPPRQPPRGSVVGGGAEDSARRHRDRGRERPSFFSLRLPYM